MKIGNQVSSPKRGAQIGREKSGANPLLSILPHVSAKITSVLVLLKIYLKVDLYQRPTIKRLLFLYAARKFRSVRSFDIFSDVYKRVFEF